SSSPRLDAELLLAHVLRVDRTGVIANPDAPVGPGAQEQYLADVARREAGEPVAYIRGFREFHGLALATDARALIPRPETELLVDAALAEVAARLTGAPRPAGTPALRVADVGTGSGAIALALLAALRARKMSEQVLVIATDASSDALDLARENAVGHGLADRVVFVEADLLPPVVDPLITLVCANLPYVATAQIDGLARELTYEPRGALDGGPDGLDVVRRLLDRLPDALAADGVALLEIGADQGETVVEAVAEHLPGWDCSVQADLAGLPRLARLRRPVAPPPSAAAARLGA
ncbi:MAG TPA: peptide chain release factor N(5)-glutamine methyltransferase, partial [Candidatus Limnocylindrales bacterium]